MSNEDMKDIIGSVLYTTGGIDPQLIKPYILADQIKLKSIDLITLEQFIDNLVSENVILKIQLEDLKNKINEIYYRRGVSY